MKIVVIHGQNHHGSTWNVARILIENIAGEKEVREYLLPGDLNHFCLGCFRCLEARECCPYWKDKEPISRDMQEADLLIFTSPNYCMMPSAPMKAFLDLFFTNWISHKPYGEMFRKRAVVISTTAGMGAGKTTKLIATNLKNWGIPEITRYGIAVNAMNWDMVPERKKQKIDRAMRKLGQRLSRGRRGRIGLTARIRFWFFGGMQKADMGASEIEKQYWLDNGWLSGQKPWKQ